MTISSSLNAGVSGLASNASRLAAIADNIANSATVGYKRAFTQFHSMVLGESPGAYSAGGVRVSSGRLIDQAGSFATTRNSTDLAVRGRGFLPVTTNSAMAGGSTQLPMMLASTGSFRTDSEGYLRTSSGHVLLGWPADSNGAIPNNPRDTPAGLRPVQIQANQYAAEATTRMTLGVNLPATETAAGSAGTPREISVEYFDNMGMSQNIGVSYTPTVPIPPSTAATNEWTMVLTDSAQANAVIGEYVVTFDDTRDGGGTMSSVTMVSGGAYNPTTGSFAVGVMGGPIQITIGGLGDLNGMSQLSDSFAPTTITKDGYPVGNLTGVEVDAGGFVRAKYDTGITRVLYQVPLADVPNPNGLSALDNQTYSISNASGQFFLWDAGDGPTGDILGYSLEESATDVAAEMTNLIQTQRAYSSNAKVIQTVDEMLQETTNIKR